MLQRTLIRRLLEAARLQEQWEDARTNPDPHYVLWARGQFMGKRTEILWDLMEALYDIWPDQEAQKWADVFQTLANAVLPDETIELFPVFSALLHCRRDDGKTCAIDAILFQELTGEPLPSFTRAMVLTAGLIRGVYKGTRGRR